MFLQEQHQIGWIQFLEGSISLRLQDMHGKYLAMTESPAKPMKWVSKLIKEVWDSLHVIWIGRCNVAHSEEESRVLQDCGEVLNQQILLEWGKGKAHLPSRYS